MANMERLVQHSVAAGTLALGFLWQLTRCTPGALVTGARVPRRSGPAVAIAAEGVGWLLIAAVLLIPLAS